MERRLQENRQTQFDRTKSEIAARVRRVCDSMPESEFDALVSRMAEIQIKYLMRRREHLVEGLRNAESEKG